MARTKPPMKKVEDRKLRTRIHATNSVTAALNRKDQRTEQELKRVLETVRKETLGNKNLINLKKEQSPIPGLKQFFKDDTFYAESTIR